MTARSRTIKVTRQQVFAARVRVAGDRALGRVTPGWIHRLADVAIPRTAPDAATHRDTHRKAEG